MDDIVVMFEGVGSGTALKDELKKKDYQVISVDAEDEDGALSVLARYNGAVKIVVVDFDTTRVYSLEFLKKIRQRGYRNPIIVIAESGSRFYPFGELDVYDVIEKPFKTSMLLNMIEECQRDYRDLRCEISSTVVMLRGLVKT